jgi:site-specific DNA-methyltransferase (adenine-specific)
MMKPYYQDKSATIYNAKWEEVLSALPDGAVNLVVTSPPYNNWRNRRTQARKAEYWQRTAIRYDQYDDAMPDDAYEAWQTAMLNECARVLRDDGTVCYNHKDRIYNFEVRSPLAWILPSKLKLRQRVTWDRCGMQAFNNVRFYRVEEDIYICGKTPKFVWNKQAAKHLSIWRITPERRNGHPAPMPLELARRCVEAFTLEGMTALDPCAGSGTVAVAAKLMGRKSVSAEISEQYCELAARRLSQEMLVPHIDDLSHRSSRAK